MSEAEAVLTADLREAALRLIELGAAARWRGPDPYDGLWARWPRFLAGGPRRRQAIVQLHARSPLDVRRLYRRKPHSLVPKAPALLGQAAVRLWRVSGNPRARALAEDAMETLAADVSCGPRAWGYPWDTQTRWSYYPGGSPNVVATAFAAQALAEAADTLDRPEWRERARRAAVWVAETLFRPQAGFFAYHERSDRLIHNANLLGAALVHTIAPDSAAADAVRSAIDRSLDAQDADGTWPYGDGRGLEWRDSFHTGYILDSLRQLDGLHPRIRPALERGVASYLTFFDDDGRALLWRDKPWPEDSHSAGTGMTVLSTLSTDGLVPGSTIARIAQRTLRSLIAPNGHAIARRGRSVASRVHYPRWCDAPVALGLANAACALELSPTAEPARAA